MGYDEKYGKVTVEWGDTPEDEPVIAFRGKDVLVPELLRHYHKLCVSEGSPQEHSDRVLKLAENIEKWQYYDNNKGRVRIPDSKRFFDR